MKNFLMIMAMFTLLVGCQKPTQYQSLKNTFNEMSYANYRSLKLEEYGFWLVDVKTKDFIDIGGDNFAVNKHDTTSYAYRLSGKRYDIYVDLHEIYPGHFGIMKKWEPWQNKYHQKWPYLVYDGLDFIADYRVLFTIILMISMLWLGWYLKGRKIKHN